MLSKRQFLGGLLTAAALSPAFQPAATAQSASLQTAAAPSLNLSAFTQESGPTLNPNNRKVVYWGSKNETLSCVSGKELDILAKTQDDPNVDIVFIYPQTSAGTDENLQRIKASGRNITILTAQEPFFETQAKQANAFYAFDGAGKVLIHSREFTITDPQGQFLTNTQNPDPLLIAQINPESCTRWSCPVAGL